MESGCKSLLYVILEIKTSKERGPAETRALLAHLYRLLSRLPLTVADNKVTIMACEQDHTEEAAQTRRNLQVKEASDGGW
ncbi:unnamed protein product [Leuciscus chuanchicus]